MASPLWLMFLYQLPAHSSTQRVYVWRKLKAAGVVYWQHSVCVLPDSPEHRQQLAELRQEIVERGGEATVSKIQLPDAGEHNAIVAKFRAQADEEYQEFLDKCRDFHTELSNERKKRHFTFAELEENEAEIAKLRTWLEKMRARDFFGGALRRQAERALGASEKDFAAFSASVAEADEKARAAMTPRKRIR